MDDSNLKGYNEFKFDTEKHVRENQILKNSKERYINGLKIFQENIIHMLAGNHQNSLRLVENQNHMIMRNYMEQMIIAINSKG